MKQILKKYHIIGTIFIVILGSLLHFVYEWFNKHPIVRIFGAINESTWEHLKLLFWPALLYSIYEYFKIGKKYKNYITGKAISFYVGTFLIVSMFYTYTGIIGRHFLVIDISIFVISTIICQIISFRFTTKNYKVSSILNIISAFAIGLLVFSFIAFSFNPPQIPLFVNPSTGEYAAIFASYLK